MLGFAVWAEPSGPPFGETVTGPKSFLTLHVTGLASPVVAGTVWVAGSTVTPWIAAVSLYGFSRNGEVRRDSTISSHTPGIGLA